MGRQEYMELLTRQIRCKRAIPLVTRELEAHIEEQKVNFMKEGISEQEAEQMAVREMGDPVEVGIRMDKIHRPRMNWRLIFFVGLISASGLGAWYYLNVRIAEKEFADNAFHLLIRNLLYTTAGFGAMIGICYADYTWFAARAKKIMAVYCGLLAAVICFFTPSAGISSYIDEGWLNAVWLMAFLFIPLYCGALYSYRGTGVLGFVKGAAWMLPIAFSLIFFGNRMEILMFLPVLAVILSYAVCTGIFRIPVKRTLAGIWGVFILLCAVAVASERFDSYGGASSPEVYREFMLQCKHTVQNVMLGSHAVGRAGEITKAFAGASKLAGIYPADDGFILTYLAVYFGTFVSAAVVLVIVALFVKLVSMTVRQKNRLGRLTGIGCGQVFLIHITGYALANTGLIIPQQMYCPFTVGGRGIIVTYVLMGVMLSIYRYQSISEA